MDHQQAIFKMQIARIQEVFLAVNEPSISTTNKGILVDLEYQLQFDITNKYIIFLLRSIYHFTDDKQPLVDFQVKNVFSTENELKDFINENNTHTLPFQVLVTMVSVAIGHSRALLSKHLAGTTFQNNMIPIMDAVSIAKSFFQEVYQSEIDVQQAAKLNVPGEDKKLSTAKKRKKSS